MWNVDASRVGMTGLLSSSSRTKGVVLACAVSTSLFLPGCRKEDRKGLPRLSADTTDTFYAGNALKGRIFSFGDIGNHGQSGWVTYDSSSKLITPYVSQKEQRIANDGVDSFTLDSSKMICGGTVVNIMLTDYNFDGLMDVIIVGQSGSKFYAGVMLQKVGTSSNTFITGGAITPCGGSGFASNPLLTDVNGDGYPDLVGNQGNNVEYVMNECYKQENGESVCLVSKVLWPTMQFYKLPVKGAAPSSLAQNSFNAVVDINGDCRPDLALFDSKNVMNFFIAQYSDSQTDCESYAPEQGSKDQSPSDRFNGCVYYESLGGDGQTVNFGFTPNSVHFTDLNSDGSMDLIAVKCGSTSGSDCTAPVMYYYINKQMVSCNSGLVFGSLSSEGCRSASSLCKADNAFTFNYQPTTNQDGMTSENFVYNAPLTTPSNGAATLQFIESLGSLPRALGLSIGDVNADGFPDLAGVFKGSSGTIEGQVWMNCGDSVDNGGFWDSGVTYDQTAQTWKSASGTNLCTLAPPTSINYKYQRRFVYTPSSTSDAPAAFSDTSRKIFFSKEIKK